MINHFVMAFHGTQRRFKNGAAGVLEFAPGRNERLLADHAFALNFGLTAIAVGDQPVTAEQLHVETPQIANGDGISEDVTFFLRYRL
ncbi:hypothetical protein D3C76_1642630 [compost metagenome]